MGKRQKQKGGAGERELSKIFEQYLGGSFIKTSSSGARVGGQNAIRRTTMSESQVRNHRADIVPPDELSKLVVESKWYKSFDYHKVVKGEDYPILEGWFKELEGDCKQEDIGLLCVKVNNKGWTVFFDQNLSKHFYLNDHVVYRGYIATGLENFLDQNAKQLIKLTG